MITKHERAVAVFNSWLARERKDRRHFRLIRRLAYLDEIMTGDNPSPNIDDLAAAQAVSQLDNDEFLQCIIALPHQKQVLTGDATEVLAWMTRVKTTAHSHLFSNLGLLMEIVLDEEAGHTVDQWDAVTIATAHQLAELSNDQLVMIMSQLATVNNQSTAQVTDKKVRNHRIHFSGHIEAINDPKQI